MRSPSPKKMKEDTPTDSVKKPSGRAPLRQKAVEPKHVAFVAIAFCTYLVFLYSIYRMLPELPDEHKHKLTLPFSVEAAQDLREVLLIYVEEAYLGTLIGGFFFYVFLQTFSIPGSAFLNFIAGAVFGVPVAFITTLLAATFGASFSYLLSYYIGSGIVRATFPDMMVLFATHLNKHRQHLFNYLLFLRLTPFLPNWFINLASPILSVPFKTFFLATFFGIMPATFIHVQTGSTMQELTTGHNWKTYATLISLGFLSLLPTLKPVQKFLDRLFMKNAD